MAPSSRDALLEKARELVLEQGLAATSVDEICAAAGVTKGCFFHYFESKDALAEALFAQWTCPGVGDFRAYLDGLIARAKAGKGSKGCLIAVLTQEEGLRGACGKRFEAWLGALKKGGATADQAAHCVAVLEGAIILERAGQHAAALRALEAFRAGL